jgi:hypothetical protein
LAVPLIEGILRGQGFEPHPLPLWATIVINGVIPPVALGITFLFLVSFRSDARKESRVALQAAGRLGLRWESYRPLPSREVASRIMLAHPGEFKACHLVLAGRVAGVGLEVLRYTYAIAERDGPNPNFLMDMRGAMGKELHADVIQLVIATSDPIENLPDFNLTPIGDLDFFYDTFCPQDRIDLSGSVCGQPFDRYYVLYGLRAAPLRNAFRREILRFLATVPGWNIQAREGRLRAWRERMEGATFAVRDSRTFIVDRSSPDKLADNVRTIVELHRLLAAAQL